MRVQRRRKTEEGFTLEPGGKRKAASTGFLREIFDAAYQPKKQRQARTMSRAVGQLFARDNEQLQTLDDELRDLNARLREVNNLRSRIMNQNYLPQRETVVCVCACVCMCACVCVWKPKVRRSGSRGKVAVFTSGVFTRSCVLCVCV